MKEKKIFLSWRDSTSHYRLYYTLNCVPTLRSLFKIGNYCSYLFRITSASSLDWLSRAKDLLCLSKGGDIIIFFFFNYLLSPKGGPTCFLKHKLSYEKTETGRISYKRALCAPFNLSRQTVRCAFVHPAPFPSHFRRFHSCRYAVCFRF
jgi:hypothetical protein